MNTSRFVSADFFLLRTPLLSFATFADVPSTTSDRPSLRARALALLERREVAAAIRHSAEAFWIALEAWRKGEENDATLRALYRYLSRMAARSTPYGMMAGVTLGERAERSNCELAPPVEYTLHARPDARLYATLVLAKATTERPLPASRWLVNPTLTRAGGAFHVTRCTRKGADYYYETRAMRASPILRSLSTVEERSFADWCRFIAAEAGDATREEVLEFARGLIDEQVLISSTALSPLSAASPALLAITPPGSPLHEELTTLARLERAPVPWHSAIKQLDAISPALSASQPGSPPFAVDLWKPGKLTLSDRVLADVASAASLLVDIGDFEEHAAFSAFVRLARERYEDATVPLLEALDPELGLGRVFAGSESLSLIEGVSVRSDAAGKLELDPRRARLHRLCVRALSNDADELLLRAEDVEALRRERRTPPTALAHVTLSAASASDLDAGRYRLYLDGGLTSDASMLLGRFALGSELLTSRLRELLATAESHSDALFAEIVHWPHHDAAGNPCRRPALRQHQLRLLAGSAQDYPGVTNLRLADLTLRITADHEVILWSRTLRRRVFVRLANAHSVGVPRALPVYAFLSQLSRRGFYFPGMQSALPRVPRIRYGNIVLRAASWRLEDGVDTPRGVAEPTRDSVRAQWGRKRMPRFARLVEGFDQQLHVDITNDCSVDEIVQRLRAKGSLIVEELIDGPESHWVKGPEGAFRHELLIPLIAARTEPSSPAAPALHRDHRPGGAWCYVDVYCSPHAADTLISYLARSIGADRDYFFLRYGDPAFHLRFRVALLRKDRWEHVFECLRSALESPALRKIVWRFNVATYRPETFRYGGIQGLAAAERFFADDSRRVSELLRLFSKDHALRDQRGLVAALGVLRILDAFEMPVADREAFLERCAGDGTGFGIRVRRRDVARRYAALRPQLEALVVSRALPASTRSVAAEKILANPSKARTSSVAGFESLAKHGTLTVDKHSIITSLIHMHLNRVLDESINAQELVIYELLRKAYASLRGRSARAAMPRP